MTGLRVGAALIGACCLSLVAAGGCDGDGEASGSGASVTDGGGGSGGSGGAGPNDWPQAQVPSSVTITANVVREHFRVAGHVPDDNPLAAVGTPDALNGVTVLRYRQNLPTAMPAHAIVLALPGFLAGAASFDSLAAAVVEAAAGQGFSAEFWAVERRSNELEDQRGFLSAEAENNPAIARAYYYGQDTIGGEAFAGFVAPTDALFASEWGLLTHAEDVRRVVDVVSAAEQRGHVFLLGHSLGGWMSESIAAWRYPDGTRGADHLAGVIMLDGVLNGAPVDLSEYQTGFLGPGLDVPGIDAVRTSSSLVQADGVTPTAWPEVMATAARLAEDEVVVDPERDAVLATALSLDVDAVPAMSNAAAFGFLYDQQYKAIDVIAYSLGAAEGGPMESYEAQSPFGTLTLERPSDPTATYTWLDAADAMPAEHVPIALLANAWSRGGFNGVEWYFPFRLMLDLYAVRGNAVAEDGYQAMEGLRAFDGPLVDAPYMVVASTFPLSTFNLLKNRIAPTVGAGRPHAGVDRDSQLGFKTVTATMLHSETTMAPAANNPIGAEVVSFLMDHAEPTPVTIALP